MPYPPPQLMPLDGNEIDCHDDTHTQNEYKYLHRASNVLMNLPAQRLALSVSVGNAFFEAS